MRLLISTALLLIVVGVALASPAKRKLEKKSISNSLAPKAIGPVDQKLDEPAKLSDEALMEVAGENVDRAKKSTKFCIEIHNNEPTQVDCDELNNRPIPPPPPPPEVPEPQEPVPPPPPPPPPAPVPQQQPEEYKFELPCEPEMAAYYIQPPGEYVYAPTGRCIPHMPVPHQLPSGNPLYTVPAGGASGIPSINVLHLPTGPFNPTGGAPGASGNPTINVLHVPSGPVPSTGHGVGPTVVPLHNIGGAGFTPVHTHLIRPSPLHYGIHHGGLPLHGLHHQTSLDCTCKSTTEAAAAKSAEGSPPSNEELARKFIQDLQRNAQAQSAGSPSSPTMVQMGPGQAASPMMIMRSPSGAPMMSLSQPGSPMMMMSSGPNSPAMAGRSNMRYMPIVRPISNVHQQQVIQQQSTVQTNGIGGTGYPMHPYGNFGPGIYPYGMLRSNADSLQDSFSSSPQVLPQGLRLSREEAEASGQVKPEQTAEEKPQEGKPSPGDIIEASKKQSEENNQDDKNSRIARFLMEENAQSNVVDEK